MGHTTNKSTILLYKMLIWRTKHQTLFNVIIWSLALALMLIVSTGFPFPVIVNDVLYPIFIFGTVIFAFQAAEKIKHLQKKKQIAKVISFDIEHIQRLLNIVITFSAAIAGIGLAAFIFNVNQSPLPMVAIKAAGMAIEIITTVFFAAVYWRLFFYMFETRSVEQAAKWAGWLSLIPTIIGAYVTVNISIFFKLNALQDSAVSLIPFLLVYYTISRSIPSYDLVINRPINIELESLTKESEQTAKELENPMLRAREKYLRNSLKKLELKKQQLFTAQSWLETGDKKIDDVEVSLQHFLEKTAKYKEDYNAKVTPDNDDKIAILAGSEVLLIHRTAPFNYRLISGLSQINDKTFEDLNDFLSYHECMVQKLIANKTLPLPDFELQAIARRNLACIEVSDDDIPKVCRDFDRKHLDDYTPSYVCLQVDSYKAAIVFRFLRLYPSTNLVFECKQIISDLHTSTTIMINKTKERISDYEKLERLCPDCHVVKEFKAWGGRLGLSSLQANLVSLENSETSLKELEEKIAEYKEKLKVENLD